MPGYKKKKLRTIPVKFLIWRLRHISSKNFILILSGIIGIISGIAAVILKETVHAIQSILTGGFDVKYANYLYLSYPLIGILCTVLLSKYILKERLGHGITNILFTISKGSSLISRTKMYSRMLTSAITVGFGGSVGLEAPIVVTGSAIGSNIGKIMHMNYKSRTLLVGCGAAGAISAIFNSPIAGVIFSIEVILIDITISAFIPLLISSVFGSLITLVLLGDEILFSFQLTEPFKANDVPFYIVLGVLCGVISMYFVRITYKVEAWLESLKNDIGRALVGGICLGFIIFIFPPIYGEGYSSIKLLLNGNGFDILNNSLFFNQINSYLLLGIFILGVILVKPIAAALTIGSGGSGGIFGPSLFLGGMTGYFLAIGMNLLPIEYKLSTSNFTLVGMCGVMSGIISAPLTAIFLIAEITNGYTLFVPLMLVSAISYSTFSYFERYSFYSKQLIEKGDLIPHNKDLQVLSLIDLSKIIEHDLLTIHPEAKLNDMVKLVRTSKRNIFPVVDKKELLGVIMLDDIREIMFDEELRQTVLIKTLMHPAPAQISSHENMQSVMNKFEKTGAWNLPVIDNNEYIGFVSKSRIFNAYRKKLIRQHKE